MTFKLSYGKNAVDAAVLYVNTYNTGAEPSDRPDVIKMMVDTARQNAKFIEDLNDECWITYTSTGGYTFIFSYEGLSKKGYPVIQCDISVSPNFYNYKFVEEKFE